MIEPDKYTREKSLSQARVFFNHCCQETSQRLATALRGARLRLICSEYSIGYCGSLKINLNKQCNQARQSDLQRPTEKFPQHLFYPNVKARYPMHRRYAYVAHRHEEKQAAWTDLISPRVLDSRLDTYMQRT